MKPSHTLLITFLIIALLTLVYQATPGRAQDSNQSPDKPVVQALLFWIEGCPSCETVLNETLPPLEAQYGEQLVINRVQLITTADIDRLYQAGADLGIPRSLVGVPFLVIGDRILIGAQQIPRELPGLIQAGLANGGIAPPQAPALAALIPEQASASESCPPDAPCPEDTVQSLAKVEASPFGPAAPPPLSPQPQSEGPKYSGLALGWVVMVGLLAALVYAIIALVRGFNSEAVVDVPRWMDILTPVLSLIGLGIAVYMTYIETQSVQAICGPVGDCNAVQSSRYATLFGWLPVGLLGAIGYVAILAAWLLGRLIPGAVRTYAPAAIFAMALVGTIFSVYLTYLELLVIRAVCIWCLSSAVVIALLLVFNVRPLILSLNPPEEE
jgi:uncharacterized membrane protein